MAINPLSQYTTPLRFGGIASGLDTDTIVKNLMRVEQLKVDKLLQSKQLAEWRRDDYRSVYDVLKKFKDTRFDVLNTSTYMLSSGAYRSKKVTSNNEDIVSAVLAGDVFFDKANFDYIESLATPAEIKGTVSVSSSMQSTADLSGGAELKGKSVAVTLDGITKTIEFKQDYSDIDSLIADFQGMLDDTFGPERIQITKQAASGTLSINTEKSSVSLSGGDALSVLGFSSGSSNRINLDAPLAAVSLKAPVKFGSDGSISFKINNIAFSFNGTSTLRQIIDDVNNSNAGVKISYSSLTDQFTITALQTGEGKTIDIENLEGNLFGADSAIGITDLVGNNGTNAVFSYNNNVVVRNTNTFTLDGIQYTLKRTFKGSEGSVGIDVSNDESLVFDRIKSFVDQYNETIEELNKVLTQERFRDFPPLTDEQKDEMTEKEVELWEEKARSGLLRGDKILSDIVNKMRVALIDEVENSGISLFSIGITTGSYLDKGKLKIDEAKLREAIKLNGDKIEKLFASKSETDYNPSLSGADRAKRYRESGLMYRLSDILNDYIRTTRDDDGKKGILLEKAGITGDVSEFNNLISEEIKRIDKRINETMRILHNREESYWRQFTAMEKAIQKMNSQSSWLMQQTMGFYQI